MKKTPIALLLLFFIIIALLMGGCHYPEIPEEVKPVRGPLQYHGPDLTPPEPVEEREEDNNGDVEEEVERQGDYFSILYWLPFERDLWGRPFNDGDGLFEEDGEDDPDNFAG